MGTPKNRVPDGIFFNTFLPNEPSFSFQYPLQTAGAPLKIRVPWRLLKLLYKTKPRSFFLPKIRANRHEGRSWAMTEGPDPLATRRGPSADGCVLWFTRGASSPSLLVAADCPGHRGSFGSSPGRCYHCPLRKGVGCPQYSRGTTQCAQHQKGYFTVLAATSKWCCLGNAPQFFAGGS